MRTQVLRQLETSPGEYVSGENMGRALGISRTAVWKYVKELRSYGYEIEASRRRGYRLIDKSSVWDEETLRQRLRTTVFGHSIQVYRQIDSTNREAYDCAEKGAHEGTLYLAEMQSSGKGRRGRTWHSPPGTGIWMSLVLRPDFSVALAPQITLMTAIAVARAIRIVSGVEAGIKWPNDILYNGKKLCGILTEMNAESDHIRFIILGIGINVNQTDTDFPDELSQIATSLRICTGKRIDRTDLLVCVLEQLEELYHRYKDCGGFLAVRQEWKELNVTLGKDVVARTGTENICGTAIDIDEFGVLWIREPGGAVRKVYSADVVFGR